MSEDELKRAWRAWLKDQYTAEEADDFFNEFMRSTRDAAWTEGAYASALMHLRP